LQPVAIDAYTLTSAVGIGINAISESLHKRISGLRANDFAPARGLNTWIGRVDAVDHEELPAAWAKYDCRNHRLARLGLEQDDFLRHVANARQCHGAERIGCLIGSSTSAILETEMGFRARRSPDANLPAEVDFRYRHSLFAVSDFVRGYLGLGGPAWTISTACTSSAKVFAAATRMLTAGLCDAVVVGGVDSLCLTTMYGFNSLELLSDTPCQPFASGRKGISIGEAAGFALLSRGNAAGPSLLGWGESSDGYHISTPAPDGAGATVAMHQALTRAALKPQDIDYINMHGTATPNNDRAEETSVFNLFGGMTPCSSTKGWTGHTLGAAGITEAIISMICLQQGLLPGNLNTREFDSRFHCDFIDTNRNKPLRHVLSNSFGFGGSNCSLIFGCPAQ
jgi:3-oxoacyl-[acyl-carrier-protein] synthase-1